MIEVPEVSVWTHSGGNVWVYEADIGAYSELRFKPSYNTPGDWEITVPADSAAEPLLDTAALVLIEYRGETSTWRITPQPSKSEEGEHVLNVSGDGALALLGDETAWRDPTAELNEQPEEPKRPYLYTGTAEEVVRSLVNLNYVQRAGRPLDLQPNQGRGDPESRARTNFANLQEVVVKKADTGGIRVDVGLVRTTDTRAVLRLMISEPADRSADVLLSEYVGSLRAWETTVEPPTLTEAIVTGATGVLKRVVTPESTADAEQWGGHRSALVSGPQSYDDEDLLQAGKEALEEGKSKTNVALTAADSEGLVAFRDYTVGDKATAILDAGLEVVDVISAIEVTMQDGFPEVVPMFGNPDADDPLVSLGQLIRSQDRRLRAQEQRVSYQPPAP